MREFAWQSDFQSEVCSFPVEPDNGRNAIDVALKEMAAQAAVCAQSSLQIYSAVPSQVLKIRATDCFLEQIKRKPVTAVRSKCQTAAIYGDALTFFRLSRGVRRGNL